MLCLHFMELNIYQDGSCDRDDGDDDDADEVDGQPTKQAFPKPSLVDSQRKTDEGEDQADGQHEAEEDEVGSQRRYVPFRP